MSNLIENTSKKHIRIRLVYLPYYDKTLTFETAPTAAQVLTDSGILTTYSLSLETLQIGIYACKIQMDTHLKDQDRLEVYRDLIISPMERRAKRAALKRKRQKLPPMGA